MTQVVGWRTRGGLGLGVAAVAGWQLRHFLTFGPRALTEHGYLADDAFFYSVLARRLHDAGFFTLDGEMATNGFQPLWMLVQVLLHGLLPSVDGVTLLAVSSWTAFVAFAFLATAYVVRGSLAQALVGAGTLLVLAAGNVGFHFLTVTGLEVPLTLALLCATLLVVDRVADGRVTPPQSVLLGFLAGACFLARTDLFWVAPVLLVWLAHVRRVPARGLLAFCGAAAVLVVPYLAWNLAEHGALVPISGRVKGWYLDQTFPDATSYRASDEWRALPVAVEALVKAHVGRGGAAFPWFAAALMVWACVGTWRFREKLPASLVLLTAGVAVHVLVMYGWYRELRPYSAYYFAPDVVWLTFVVAFAARSVVRRWPVVLAALVLAACAGVAFRASLFAERDPKPSPYWRARLAMADRLPARVGAFWPGAFAQFADADVTPLDGVVGSDAYFEEHVRTGTELDYLAARGIRHVVVYLPAGPGELLAGEPPQVTSWNERGRVRLWEARDRLEVVDAVPFGDAGEGWYLVRVTE